MQIMAFAWKRNADPGGNDLTLRDSFFGLTYARATALANSETLTGAKGQGAGGSRVAELIDPFEK